MSAGECADFDIIYPACACLIARVCSRVPDKPRLPRNQATGTMSHNSEGQTHIGLDLGSFLFLTVGTVIAHAHRMRANATHPRHSCCHPSSLTLQSLVLQSWAVDRPSSNCPIPLLAQTASSFNLFSRIGVNPLLSCLHLPCKRVPGGPSRFGQVTRTPR
jgi:hypothetical protein